VLLADVSLKHPPSPLDMLAAAIHDSVVGGIPQSKQGSGQLCTSESLICPGTFESQSSATNGAVPLSVPIADVEKHGR
jgi:hypothetical protein